LVSESSRNLSVETSFSWLKKDGSWLPFSGCAAGCGQSQSHHFHIALWCQLLSKPRTEKLGN